MTKEQQIDNATCGLSRMVYSRYQVDRYGIKEGKLKYDKFKIKKLQLQKDLLDFGIPCNKLKVLKVRPLPTITVGDIACEVDTPTIAYEHTQSTSALVWIITHNLYFNPSVTIVDENGFTVDALVQYISNTTVKVLFSIPTSGKAYLS